MGQSGRLSFASPTESLSRVRWQARPALASAHCFRSAAARQRAKARCEAVRCIGWLGGRKSTLPPFDSGGKKLALLDEAR